MSRGFDEFFGFLGGQHSYMDTAAQSVDPILDGRKPATAMTYLTDALATRGGAREGASLPALSGVQCQAHADARHGQIPRAIQEHCRPPAPHLCRSCHDGRCHRPHDRDDP